MPPIQSPSLEQQSILVVVLVRYTMETERFEYNSHPVGVAKTSLVDFGSQEADTCTSLHTGPQIQWKKNFRKLSKDTGLVNLHEYTISHIASPPTVRDLTCRSLRTSMLAPLISSNSDTHFIAPQRAPWTTRPNNFYTISTKSSKFVSSGQAESAMLTSQNTLNRAHKCKES